MELGEPLRGTFGTDPIAAFNGRFYSGSTLKPTAFVTTYVATVSTHIAEQAPPIKTKSPVLQFPSFGARVEGGGIGPSIKT